MPAFHVGALNPFVTCLQRGVKMVVMSAFDADGAWAVIESERVTNTVAVPAMLQEMLVRLEAGEVDASSVRWILTGGSPTPVPLLEAYAAHDISILGGYGLTENCGLGCVLMADEARERIGEQHKLAQCATQDPLFGCGTSFDDCDGRVGAAPVCNQVLHEHGKPPDTHVNRKRLALARERRPVEIVD